MPQKVMEAARCEEPVDLVPFTHQVKEKQIHCNFWVPHEKGDLLIRSHINMGTYMFLIGLKPPR